MRLRLSTCRVSEVMRKMAAVLASRRNLKGSMRYFLENQIQLPAHHGSYVVSLEEHNPLS